MSTTLDARARHDVGINQGQTGVDDVLKGCEATQSPMEGGRKGDPWGPRSPHSWRLPMPCAFRLFLTSSINHALCRSSEGQSSSYWLSEAKFSSVERDEMAVCRGLNAALTPCHFPDWRAEGIGQLGANGGRMPEGRVPVPVGPRRGREGGWKGYN